MKKTFLLSTLFVLAAFLGNVTAQSLTFGYCGDYATSLGGVKATTRTLIQIPAETAALYQGASITAVNAVVGESGGKKINIVILNDKTDATPVYSQEHSATNSKWNNVTLTTPYVLDGKEFYVGIEMDITSSSYYPLAIDGGPANPYGDWLGMLNGGKWEFSHLSEMGFNTNNCITITLTGENLPKFELDLQSIKVPEAVMAQAPFTIAGTVKNNGVNNISSYEVSYSIDGGEAVTTTIEQNIAQGQTATFEILSQGVASTGVFNIDVTVSKVDGNNDQYADNNTLSAEFQCVEKLATRKVLLENFSTAQCGNCPPVHSMLGDILKDRNDVIWVAHHAGYYTDDFTISESEEYLAFFGTRGTFAPAMMLDRRNLIEQGAYTMDNCPVFGYTGDPSVVENLIDYCQGKPAFIEVNLSTQFVKDSRELIITVSGEECAQLPEDIYLTIFLLENGLKGKQAGSSNKNYDHSHVIRDVVTATWGDKLDRVDNAYSIKYTTTLDSKWVEENMSVVAFISDYNKSDINDRVVYNANDIKVLNEASVEGVDNDTNNVWSTNGCIFIDGQYDKAEVFNLDGRLVAQANGDNFIRIDAAGIYLIRIDGKTSKVVVK